MQLPTESSVGVERQLKRQCDTTYGRNLDSGIVDGEEHAIEDEQHDAAVHRDNKQAPPLWGLTAPRDEGRAARQQHRR